MILAAYNGYVIGREKRDMLVTNLAPEQIVEAQKMAREWLKEFKKS